jgi:hypothetical protein
MSYLLTIFLVLLAVFLIMLAIVFIPIPRNNNNFSLLFLQVIFGLEHKSPQGIAHYWVLVIGFILESTVLHSTVNSNVPVIMMEYPVLVEIVIDLIIFNLIFHQILIFRNFSVSDAESYNSANMHLQTISNNSTENLKKILLCITFLIFIGISAVAGEFGYLFAVSKLAHIGDTGGIISWLINTLGATKEVIEQRFKHELPINNPEMLTLKYSLKGLFVMGATILCVLVIAWDIVIKFIPDEYKKFEGVWLLFIFMDLLSLSVWVFISPLIIPNADFMTSMDVWIFLMLIMVIYSVFSGLRIWKGYAKITNTNDLTDTSKIAL